MQKTINQDYINKKCIKIISPNIETTKCKY